MKCFFTLLLISLVGCTSIDQPTAQRQLVNKIYAKQRQLLSDDLWRSLLDENEGYVINLKGQKVALGKVYVSATGRLCRKLFWKQSVSHHFSNLSCQSSLNNAWYFVEPVLAEYNNEQNTQGAGK